MREADQPELPGIQAHGRGRGFGAVVLVTASALLVAGAVTGWVLIGDGQGSAASLGSAGTANAQHRPDNLDGADSADRSGGSEGAGDQGGEQAEVPLPPAVFWLPPLPEETATPDRGERGESSDSTDSSDTSDTSDERSGQEPDRDRSERSDPPEPEPTRAPEPDPKPQQPRPRVGLLTTEAEYGFAAGVRIVNEGDRPLTWTMRLTYDDVRVTGGWQADVRQTGSRVTIRGQERTATIPPGEQAVFGFHLTGQVQEPTGCTLNGKPCRLTSR